mgnify:CR=1 FL=1
MNEVLAEKQQLIRKNGLLEYFGASETFVAKLNATGSAKAIAEQIQLQIVDPVALRFGPGLNHRVEASLLAACLRLFAGADRDGDALAGAERVMEELEHKLGIKVGETDPTGMFTIQQMECLGACDRAPVVMVNNNHWHEHADPDTARAPSTNSASIDRK